MSATPTRTPERLDALAPSLRPLATPAGAICTLALDHRDAMRNAYARAGVPTVSEQTILEAKMRIVDALADCVSSILLDTAALARCRRASLGLLTPLERQGHDPLEGGRLNRLLDDFGPADAAALGAHACKLLLYYRADHAPTAERQRSLVAQAAADCHRHGLALVVEPLVYRLAGEDEQVYARCFDELVVAAARDVGATGVDLLKLQFPRDAAACMRLTEAAAPLPWTLLGGSDVGGETFARQLEAACAAGARGFIAGRAIWGGALPLEPERQTAWLRDHARPLMAQLTDIADTHARRLR
jgi:tagatose-1,6-bisphosphate aldolase